MNEGFRFQRTRFGGNFHCSSVPQEMLHHAEKTGVRLKHWGYIHREDRIRKYKFYNTADPANLSEDCYRHMVIGDLYPADSRFKHAGPLELVPFGQLSPDQCSARMVLEEPVSHGAVTEVGSC
jgi:hypothetical protein